MATVRDFKELVVWQLSRELEQRVVAFTATPPASHDVDFCRQIRNSSSSAARNIAEGFGRYTPRDFARFVRTARGSLHETRDHLDAGLQRKYLEASAHAELVQLARRAIGAATRFVVYLDDTAERWDRERRRTRSTRTRNNREP